jgi:hypothetical protein
MSFEVLGVIPSCFGNDRTQRRSRALTPSALESGFRGHNDPPTGLVFPMRPEQIGIH